ncbi:MAG TPA: amino acid adenylation domain-containing protein, partial [Thiotrichales bacterium]|nr:amino acid adenylation domain-containing protein [Thiotrichales bacterium]
LQNVPLEPLELKGLALQPVNRTTDSTRFDLECHVWTREQGMEIVFVYNTDLFETASMQRMLQHYRLLLEQLVEHPAQPVSQYRLLTEQEQQQLQQWNQTQQSYAATSLVEMFEQQVDATPDATAIVFENTRLDYRQLDEQANRLAHYLQAQGIGEGEIVGVCMERSIEMVVALYGIIKAGAAYVPLDPDYPESRLAFMLEDTGLSLVLSQSHLAARLPADKVRLLPMDTTDATDRFPAHRLKHSIQPDSAAYIIYSSGSTGQPKGVINTHRGIVNRLCWMQQQFKLDEQDSVLQKTPYSFDVSVWEFFWPLISGARLIVAQPGGHKDPAYLSRVIQAHAVTTVHFVPSMLKAWLDHLHSNTETAPATLRRVLCSGEALPYTLQQQFFAQFAEPVELHNLYGPTEAAIDVTHWQCQRNDSRHVVPIGVAIANTQIHLLDEQLQPVPVGIIGELYIGGVQVAAGYLNRDALNAERFISDPFSHDPAARLYKSGDLARYLPDGSIEYIGRVDFQVKLRGQRIELGEIEAALVSNDAIREAVVLCRQSGEEQQLLAYCTLEQPGDNTVNPL